MAMHTLWTSASGLLLISALLMTVHAVKRPHIVVVMADDLGWNDVGFRNPEMYTPNIDKLAREGVILNNSYATHACTPSRAAFLTGIYPFHLGLQTHHSVFYNGFNNTLPLKHKLLPEHLKELGYDTHYVGKWHVGFCDPKTTSTGRGFDTFYGMYGGVTDYFTHDFRNGYDFHDDSGSGFRTDWSANGTYSTTLFTNRALRILENHDQAKPLFLFVGYQAVHTPHQVPDHYVTGHCSKNIGYSEDRKLLCGMGAAMDEGIGKIYETLDKLSFTEDLILLFMSDNGGPINSGASNWPLRGSKKTLWEGGTRVVTILHSNKYLPNAPYVWNGLTHVVDWLPNLVRAAKKYTKVPDIDGVNSWWRIMKNRPHSVRKEFVYNIDLGRMNTSAIRWKNYKLINNKPGQPDRWYYPPPSETIGSINGTVYKKYPEFMLFNLDTDPSETTNLIDGASKKEKWVLKVMKEKLAKYKLQVQPPMVATKVKDAIPGKGNNFTWITGWCKVNE